MCVCVCVCERERERERESLLPYLSSMQSACAVLYCHLLSVWLYHIISTLPHKRHHFQEKVIEHEVYCLIFATTLSETFLILRKIQRDINVHRS